MRARGLSKARADVLAARLELDLDDGICHACLSFVSFALDRGDEREVRSWVLRMTPDLWSDGLDVQALAAVRRAVAAGVTDAQRALEELELKGARTAVARAIVQRLAGELAARSRRDPWLNPKLLRARPSEAPTLN